MTGADVHMPYSKRLEQAAIPHAEHVVSAALGDPGGIALMAEIVMPRLSDSMEEGTILTWLKQVGDEVAVGDELVEIETDKANMAYETDVAGTLTEILAQEGETLAIGQPIAVVGDPGEGSELGSCGACRRGRALRARTWLRSGASPVATRRRAVETPRGSGR